MRQRAIDGRLIEGKHIQMTELAGGCVCCSLVGEFEAAVEEIVESVHPELLVVETTGVAEPDAVIFDVQDNLPAVRLDSVVVIADAHVMIRFPDLGYVTRAQFEAADTVLINKIDLVSEQEVAAVAERVRQVNPEAVTFKVVRCELDVELLFGAMDPARRHRPSGRIRHHDLEISSFVYRTDRLLDRRRFEEVAQNLPQEVYRAKGFLCSPDGAFLYNSVAGHWDFEPFEADRTELVFIGKGVDEVEQSLLSQLAACEMPRTRE